jgi:hypothetical protein
LENRHKPKIQHSGKSRVSFSAYKPVKISFRAYFATTHLRVLQDRNILTVTYVIHFYRNKTKINRQMMFLSENTAVQAENCHISPLIFLYTNVLLPE